MDGAKSTVRMGKEAGIALSHILNPVTKEPESVRVEHATGFIFKGADCYSAKEMSVEAPGLKFSWPEKAAFTSRVQYSNG
jgi:hypothetical protein